MLLVEWPSCLYGAAGIVVMVKALNRLRNGCRSQTSSITSPAGEEDGQRAISGRVSDRGPRYPLGRPILVPAAGDLTM